MKVSELLRILKKSGKCHLVRHGGEHDVWHSDISGKDFYVPRHKSKEVKTGTAQATLK